MKFQTSEKENILEGRHPEIALPENTIPLYSFIYKIVFLGNIAGQKLM